jgi:ParB family chromosome partitioning protein
MSARKGGLGKGLDTLIPTKPNAANVDANSNTQNFSASNAHNNASNTQSQNSTTGANTTNTVSFNGEVVAGKLEVDIKLVKPNPKQPRTVFNEEALAELAASIKEVGILQPPVVRKTSAGYELIMGERRWRASQLAGLTKIPVIVRETKDNELLREALLENIHRSELNALEEGSAYQNLINDFGYTHDELAQKVGKSRSAITNTLRLLQLPPSVQRRLAAGTLSAGHARALLSLDDIGEIERLANRVIAEGLSVRALEEIVLGYTGKKKQITKSSGPVRNKEASDLLSDFLDTRVNVEMGKAKGTITIDYADNNDLARIMATIRARKN